MKKVFVIIFVAASIAKGFEIDSSSLPKGACPGKTPAPQWSVIDLEDIVALKLDGPALFDTEKYHDVDCKVQPEDNRCKYPYKFEESVKPNGDGILCLEGQLVGISARPRQEFAKSIKDLERIFGIKMKIVKYKMKERYTHKKVVANNIAGLASTEKYMIYFYGSEDLDKSSKYSGYYIIQIDAYKKMLADMKYMKAYFKL